MIKEDKVKYCEKNFHLRKMEKTMRAWQSGIPI